MAANINNTLDGLMKKYIRSTGHNKSGALSSSIKFNATYFNGNFDMGLQAKEYILYLDNGKFVKNFMALPAVKKVVSEFVVQSMLDEL
jgi:hypothetical protein